jgi:N-terminal region of glycosyl transferase group 7/N-terminal domain of galactosyltransferase
MTKRLNIVVPYRDREDHLRHFVPALRTYFARDKTDRDIPYRALIIEQESGLPFNRGALNNIGFLLGRSDCDYTCFHDIDYLPLRADYQWSNYPVAIVWYGAETRLIDPSRPEGLVVTHDLEKFFGAVVLTPNDVFAAVNGYSNDYWGWGYEDIDLHSRFAVHGITMKRRKGTFNALDHVNQGFNIDGSPSQAHDRNKHLLSERWSSHSKMRLLRRIRNDGLLTVKYQVTEHTTIPEGPVLEREAVWEKVTVRLLMQPPTSRRILSPTSTIDR